MTKFVDDNILDIWWDKNITAGYDFWEQIDFHIENRDIICLFISANYLASKACKEEMRRACELRTQNGICVVPIILSSCSWLDYENILFRSNLLYFIILHVFLLASGDKNRHKPYSLAVCLRLLFRYLAGDDPLTPRRCEPVPAVAWSIDREQPRRRSSQAWPAMIHSRPAEASRFRPSRGRSIGSGRGAAARRHGRR